MILCSDKLIWLLVSVAHSVFSPPGLLWLYYYFFSFLFPWTAHFWQDSATLSWFTSAVVISLRVYIYGPVFETNLQSCHVYMQQDHRGGNLCPQISCEFMLCIWCCRFLEKDYVTQLMPWPLGNHSSHISIHLRFTLGYGQFETGANCANKQLAASNWFTCTQGVLTH